MIWSKEVLMDRTLCRNIRTLGVNDMGSAGGDGTHNWYFVYLRRSMAVDGKTLLMIITWYRIQ